LIPQGFINPRGIFAALTEYPEEHIKIWDDLNKDRKVIGFSGSDAHGPMLLGFPSYKDTLGSYCIHIPIKRTDSYLPKEEISASLRSGNFYMAVDAIAVSRYFDFKYTSSNGKIANMGDEIVLKDTEGKLSLRLDAPKGAYIKLIKDGELVQLFDIRGFDIKIKEKGVYRAEVWKSTTDSPYSEDKIWIISNPIFIR
jgi:hypothetical protein